MGVPEAKEKKVGSKEKQKKLKKDAAAVANAKIAASFDDEAEPQSKPKAAKLSDAEKLKINSGAALKFEEAKRLTKEQEAADAEETKLIRGVASLQEMLEERLKQQLAAKDDGQVLELEADIDILRGLVSEKKQELAKETARRL